MDADVFVEINPPQLTDHTADAKCLAERLLQPGRVGDGHDQVIARFRFWLVGPLICDQLSHAAVYLTKLESAMPAMKIGIDLTLDLGDPTAKPLGHRRRGGRIRQTRFQLDVVRHDGLAWEE